MGLEANEPAGHSAGTLGDSGCTGGRHVTPSPRQALMARATSLLQGHQERQGAAQQEGGAHSPSGRHLRGKDPALTNHISPGVPSLCGELSPPAPCWGGCGLGLAPCRAAGASPGALLPAGGGLGVLRLVPNPQDGSWCPWGGRSSVWGTPPCPCCLFHQPPLTLSLLGPRQHPWLFRNCDG